MPCSLKNSKQKMVCRHHGLQSWCLSGNEAFRLRSRNAKKISTGRIFRTLFFSHNEVSEPARLREIGRKYHLWAGTSWTISLILTCLLLLVSGCASFQSGPALSVYGKEPGIPADPPLMLAAQVDLDYVYDPDLRQQEKNLRLLTQRVCNLGLTTVLLQAFADPDGNDAAEALYFPNRALPMRRNLFPRVAQALQHCGVKVYAWMPMLAFVLKPEHKNLLVQRIEHPDKTKTTAVGSRRLSPFNSASRAIIRGIYEDLARSASFDGILFHDDAVLSDFEDASPAARTIYKKAGFPADITRIRNDDVLMKKWSRFKTKTLIHFSESLLAVVRSYHPHIRSGRALYARTILQPVSEQWFAQSLPLFLQTYDYTFVLAMPFMEQADNRSHWLINLADRALAETQHPSALVFELQTVDWRNRQKITTAEIITQMKLLNHHGIISFAYYPDDFLRNHPDSNSLQFFFAGLKASGEHNSHD